MGAPMLTPGEERAEELLYAAISRKYTYSEFLIEAHHLERESPEGAAYLRFFTRPLHRHRHLAHRPGRQPGEHLSGPPTIATSLTRFTP